MRLRRGTSAPGGGPRRSVGIPVLVAGCLAASACGMIRPIKPPVSVGIPVTGATAIAVPAITAAPALTPTPTPSPTAAPARPTARPTAVPTPRAATMRPAPAVARTRGVVVPAPVAVVTVPRSATPAPPPPAVAPVASLSTHLVGPGVDVLVSPMAPYDCAGYSPPLPTDRAIIDPCAQPVTGVPLIDGHNFTNLLWNATIGWGDGTVVHWGGHTWRIVQTRVVDHYITYYPMPPAGAGLQIRTCQPDGLHEWVWDLDEVG